MQPSYFKANLFHVYHHIFRKKNHKISLILNVFLRETSLFA